MATITRVTLEEYERDIDAPRWYDGKLIFLVIGLLALVVTFA